MRRAATRKINLRSDKFDEVIADVVFLGVCRAYDYLPHITILNQLRIFCTVGPMFYFIEASCDTGPSL